MSMGAASGTISATDFPIGAAVGKALAIRASARMMAKRMGSDRVMTAREIMIA